MHILSIAQYRVRFLMLWEYASIQEKIVYADSSEWEASLSALFRNFNERVYLVVSDDNFFRGQFLIVKQNP